MGGAIVTERIFNIHGVGGFLYRSIRPEGRRVGRRHRDRLVHRLPVVNLSSTCSTASSTRGSAMTERTSDSG